MKNDMTTYDANKEDKKTLETMANNFDQGYDGDPTEEQIKAFEKHRTEKIKDTYDSFQKNLELEEKTFEMVSEDGDIQNALKDIMEFHKDQYRKIGNIPYTDHPIAVAKIISRVTNDKKLIIAWLLHDVIEDVEGWRMLLESKYTGDILGLVDDVTEQDKSLPRKERKVAYIKHLDTVSGKSLILSLSDRIHNLRGMIKWLEENGPAIWEKFNAWFEEQKWFILSYSLQVKRVIDQIQDIKIKWQCLDLYNELSALIWYFLEIWKK